MYPFIRGKIVPKQYEYYSQLALISLTGHSAGDLTACKNEIKKLMAVLLSQNEAYINSFARIFYAFYPEVKEREEAIEEITNGVKKSAMLLTNACILKDNQTSRYPLIKVEEEKSSDNKVKEEK